MKTTSPQKHSQPTKAQSGYTSIRELGRGGTCTVQLIRQPNSDLLLALKTPLESSSEISQLFTREISLTQRLKFPGVVRSISARHLGVENGILMPHLKGPSLETFRTGLPEEAARNLISSLAITLYYLQLRGVSHGDFKPHNIFLPEGFNIDRLSEDQLFYPKLIDFSMGLAQGEAASSRLGLGTLGYSAPETLKEGELTPLSEIFSLGVVAYVLTTGEHPFITREAEPAAISAAVREHTPPQPHELAKGISHELSSLIMSMLSKEPALRPQNGFVICQRLAELGATYPFDRAILPKHLLPNSSVVDIAGLVKSAGFDLPARSQLHRITGGETHKTRIILDASFRAGVLVWREGVLRGVENFHRYVWPERLKKVELERLAELRFSEKRWVIKCAVAGGIDRLTVVEPPPDTLRPALTPSSLVEAVRGRLSRKTVRRLSLRLGSKLLESPRLENEYELASNLYIQAQEVDRATALTLSYCSQLARDNREVEALPLLARAEALAEEFGSKEQLIPLLHRDGDIRKGIGDMQGAETRYQRVVQLSGNTPTHTLAETYKDLGDVYKLKQDYVKGLDSLFMARELYQQFEDTIELARVANNIGNIHWINSDHKLALRSYREALKLSRANSTASDVASIVNNIASIFAVTGRLNRAIRIYKLCLKLKREIGDRGEIARTLNNLGFTLYLRGQFMEALEVLEEALDINRALGSNKELLFNLDNISSCAVTAGRFGEALRYVREGRDIAADLHDRPTKAAFDLTLAKILTRTGLWKHAERLANRTQAVGKEFGDKSLVIRSLIQLADLKKRQLKTAEANEFAKEALMLAREIQDMQGIVFGMILADNGDGVGIREALSLSRTINAPRDVALAALELAEFLFAQKKIDESRTTLSEVREYMDKSKHDVDWCRYKRLQMELELSSSKKLSQDHVYEILKLLNEVSDRQSARDEKTELWQTEIALGDAALRVQEYEQAYAALRRAMKAVRSLTGELTEKSAIDIFVSQPRVVAMGSHITDLKRALRIT